MTNVASDASPTVTKFKMVFFRIESSALPEQMKSRLACAVE